MKDHLRKFVKDSATILWARIVAFTGFIFAVLDLASDLLQVPGINENISTLLNPRYVPWYLIAVSLITEVCRRRTLPKDKKDDA